MDVRDGSVKQESTVTISGNTIQEVRQKSSLSEDGKIIDMRGYYLLPGLINVHNNLSHVFPFKDINLSESPAETVLRCYRAAHDALLSGVTTLRTVGEIHRADLSLRKMIDTKWVDGPRIIAGGKGLCITGGHGSHLGQVEADNPDEFRKAARKELALGAQHLKIFITGGIAVKGETFEEPQMTEEEMRAVATVARSKGTYVCAHAGSSHPISIAIRAGVKCIEHAYILDKQTAREMKNNDCYLVPTLSVTRSPGWMKEHSFEPWTIEKAVQSGEDHMKSIRNAVRAGTNIAMGTDIPPGDMNDGVNASVREMELMTQIGMSNLDVVRASTIMPAKLCRIDNLVGQLSEGMLADLIAIPRNPLEDIRNLRQIPFVIKHGWFSIPGRGLEI